MIGASVMKELKDEQYGIGTEPIKGSYAIFWKIKNKSRADSHDSNSFCPYKIKIKNKTLN